MTTLQAIVASAAVAASMAAAGGAQAACRLALSLALDVSGSVDAEEYQLQLHGVADALTNSDVQAALLAIPELPVAMSVFEWSSASYQQVLVDWRLIESADDIAAVSQVLKSRSRSRAPNITGLGAAMVFGAEMMGRAPQCWKQTLDVSADGMNNDWPAPKHVMQDGSLGSMDINALVIVRRANNSTDYSEVDILEMTSYFEANVIRGPDAFIEVARGYQDYTTAMARKLLRELATRPVSTLPSPRSTLVEVRPAAYVASQ